ncbi:MAG: endonuclease [Muribaculaceae bacterium]|nr:endonuclease [Muribaculaceae bacterium]
MILYNKLSAKRILLTAAAVSIFALSGYAEYDPAYYAGLEGKKRETLKAAVKEAVKSHRQLVYMDLPNYWQYSDVYPELVDGKKRWWEMYSNAVYTIGWNQSAKSSFSANKMQREHSVPKSWWKVGNDVEYTPAYTDMWNLYPSDGEANMAKSNYPLGPVATATFDNGCTKVGVPVYGYGGGAGSVFEPDDEYKGDFARSFFYMACVYDDIQWQSRYSWMFIKSSYPTLQPWAYEMLLQWARQDQVSQKEILRNDAVEASQGNRNPFVDFPELAEYIWGTRTSEVFRIADQGGAVTPPITGDPELTLPVNDEWLDFGEVALSGLGSSWLVLKGNNFTAPLSVRVGGNDKDMFSIPVRSIPASSINTTGEYMLPIQYQPTALGEHTATLSIYDGGMDTSVRVNLKGKAMPIPTLSRLTALTPVDVTDNAYTAVWTESPEPVDYYIVYRTRYSADGEEIDEYESTSTSLRIEGRDPSVAESYSVCSSRLGYLSPRSNSVLIETSGVGAISAEASIQIACVEGGLRILTPRDGVGIEIFDAAGRLIARPAGLSHGDFIPLPQGVYIITSPSLPMPVKACIAE